MNSNNPTLKILTIVASAVILLSFFLPWVQSFGQSASAAKIIAEVVNSLKYIGEIHNDQQAIYLLIPLSLLVMPICSFIVLLITSISKTQRPLRFPKILMAIVMTLYMGFLIYGESQNPFSGLGGSVFSALGFGFYFTFLNVIFLFVTVFFKPKQVLVNPITVNNQPKRFCPNCGQPSDPANPTSFCLKCGTEL